MFHLHKDGSEGIVKGLVSEGLVSREGMLDMLGTSQCPFLLVPYYAFTISEAIAQALN